MAYNFQKRGGDEENQLASDTLLDNYSFQFLVVFK